MDDIIKKYMDFWETVTHEALLNPKVISEWQTLMQAQCQWMTDEPESERDS